MENNKFKRKCPSCKKELSYTNIKNRNQANKHNIVCVGCKYKNNIEKNRKRFEDKYLKFNDEQNKSLITLYNEIGTNIKLFGKAAQPLLNEFRKEIKEEKGKIIHTRNCPECNKEIIYKTKFSKERSEQEKCLCNSCCSKGEKNHFFGKTHKKESMSKMLKTKETSEAYKEHLEYIRSDEHRKMLSELVSGENNPRYQRPLKKIWIEKYGEEQGLKRWEEWKQLSKESAPKGELNHQFGKPSPVGSGNGWSGWYIFEDESKWFFRSFLELSYMVNEIVAKNLKWENGELKKFIINYNDYDGKNRNYFPDFVIDNKYIIECKPLNLHNSATVKAKKEAAEKYCLENNMEYIMLQPDKLSNNEILELYNTKKIVFMPRYEEKFKTRFLK